MTLEQRMEQLKAMQPKIDGKIASAAQNATLRAMEKAAELTPPTAKDLRGTNTRTGEMKQHWSSDSKPKPTKNGGSYTTILANNMQYASYVNDGHRMDRHFVPGLYINPDSGMLELMPGAKVGIVVGTKTAYVPGLFMVEAAKEEYSRVVKTELADLEAMFK